jgi:hypothetical protein
MMGYIRYMAKVFINFFLDMIFILNMSYVIVRFVVKLDKYVI